MLVRRSISFTAALVATLVFLSTRSSGQTSPTPEARSVRGRISSVRLTGGECTSPVGLCYQGAVLWRHQGELRFQCEHLDAYVGYACHRRCSLHRGYPHTHSEWGHP